MVQAFGNKKFSEAAVVRIMDTVSNRDYSKQPIHVKVGNKEQKPAFGGKFMEATLGTYITKVLYNDPVTVVFFSDGTKTTSKCQKGDTYNKEMGLTMCVLKRLVGGDQVAALFKSWVTENKTIDLKMVRENSSKNTNK